MKGTKMTGVWEDVQNTELRVGDTIFIELHRSEMKLGGLFTIKVCNDEAVSGTVESIAYTDRRRLWGLRRQAWLHVALSDGGVYDNPLDGWVWRLRAA